MTNLTSRFLAGCVTAIAVLDRPVAGFAQDAKNQGYIVDTQGQNAIVKAAGASVCVRASDW